ncbi:S16 family serine protease [Vibrio nitrifigilis]|uniref:endopeptidase La n=1 Tax=Vibrio nitrifigilis TaxID=2789781 RepID=A0ABS0GDI0_9VIBR|nr:Lon protease family protein [Vibrio nitrifigilis]MBF9000474.1 Lon protease family protein [Vibrio nitrifigilis]
MTKEIWRSVTPQYDAYNSQIEQYASLEENNLLDVQPRLSVTLSQFIEMDGFTRLLLINAPDNSIYRHLIQGTIQQRVNEDTPVIISESLNIDTLFGQVKAENGHVIHEVSGLLDKADGGYLIVSANLLIANPVSWPLLKAALLGEETYPLNCDPKSPIQSSTAKRYNVKLVVVGDRNQLGDVDYLDPDIHSGLCLFSEIELDLKINEQSIVQYLGYLKWLCQQYDIPHFTADGIKALLTAGARYTEDQHYAPLCLLWHRSILSECKRKSHGQTITAVHVEDVIKDRYYRASYLPERAMDDILDGQVIIETQGEQIGQVNGLTVVDVAGHPLSYGEPARISCVIHFGDGDIADVERKVDLGGNLHAKGMMIMQAFVSSALNLDMPLPFSASVVFEQSYSEVDGDSASLAELCSLVSALSETPIDQQKAVTGAVDQFGRVQAVGGLNEKIEGFYRVCEHQGFTGQQGVILPASNLKHLALHPTVVDSIRSGQFNIWPVSTVDDVIPLLLGEPFRSDENSSILNKIAERIDNFEKHEQPSSLIDRLKNWLFSH